MVLNPEQNLASRAPIGKFNFMETRKKGYKTNLSR